MNDTPSTAAGGIGDINSTAAGSGARYNAGKPALDLVPLWMLADYYGGLDYRGVATATEYNCALHCLRALGLFQAREGDQYLLEALHGLGNYWDECAKVFDFGRRKYSEWNWAKGMPWSVPIGCAARHLKAILEGKPDDEDSGLPHAGHVYCNLVMLLQYTKTYREGDDRPPQGLLTLLPAEQLQEVVDPLAVGDSHEALTFHALVPKPSLEEVCERVGCSTCRYDLRDEEEFPCKYCDACDRWECA